MTSRREVLGGMIAVPIVGLGGPYRMSAEPSPPLEKSPWIVLAGRLFHNMGAYETQYFTDHDRLWPEAEKEATRLLCYRFCYHLLEGKDLSLETCPWLKERDPELMKRVRFEAFNGGPVDVFKNSKGEDLVLKAMARRIKLRYLHPNIPIYPQDSSYGVTVAQLSQESQIDQLGAEAALEVKIEIRHDYENGNAINLYALYWPPHATPSFLDPKDFSVHHSIRMRYSKSAA